MLAGRTWDNNSAGRSQKTVKTDYYIYFKEKIEINPKEPRYLKVVWGIGYKFEKDHRG